VNVSTAATPHDPREGGRDAAGGSAVLASRAVKKADREAREEEAGRRLHQKLFLSGAGVLDVRHRGACGRCTGWRDKQCGYRQHRGN
jgi:hypothetical protein